MLVFADAKTRTGLPPHAEWLRHTYDGLEGSLTTQTLPLTPAKSLVGSPVHWWGRGPCGPPPPERGTALASGSRLRALRPVSSHLSAA